MSSARKVTLTDDIKASWAETDRLRALLKTLEWSGSTVVYYDGASADSCPSCGGIKPGEIVYEAYSDDSHFGHAADCELDAALAPSRSTSGTASL